MNMGKCNETLCKNQAKKGHLYCGLHSKTGGVKKGITYVSKPACHTGNVLVHTIGDINIYGGGSSRSGGWWRMLPYPDLAIGPAEIVNGKGPGTIDERWLDSKSAQWLTESMPIVLGLDWPDFSIPKGVDGQTMPREFWLALVEDIHARGIKTISTQCMGGHGRTGVALGILIYLLTPEEERTWTSVAELLEYIHEVYCKEAVEGDSQAEYIGEMCDIELGDYTLHHSRANWGTGGAGGWTGHAVGYDGGLLGTTPNGKGSWCSGCRKWCDPKTVMNATCDTCWDKENDITHADEDEDDDERVFRCDTCPEIYDWDIGVCKVCEIGQVLPDDEKGDDDEGFALLGLE